MLLNICWQTTLPKNYDYIWDIRVKIFPKKMYILNNIKAKIIETYNFSMLFTKLDWF